MSNTQRWTLNRLGPLFRKTFHSIGKSRERAIRALDASNGPTLLLREIGARPPRFFLSARGHTSGSSRSPSGTGCVPPPGRGVWEDGERGWKSPEIAGSRPR
jgi:hypothetical protein